MKKLIAYLSKLIQSNTKESSIRAGMIFTIGVVSISILAVTTALIISVLNHGRPDWFGAASFVVALSTMYGVAVYGKIQQKKAENLPQPNAGPGGNPGAPGQG